MLNFESLGLTKSESDIVSNYVLNGQTDLYNQVLEIAKNHNLGVNAENYVKTVWEPIPADLRDLFN